MCRYVGQSCLCAWDPGTPGSTPVLPNEPIRYTMKDHIRDWHNVFGKHHPLEGLQGSTSTLGLELGIHSGKEGSTSTPGLEFGIHPGKETVKTDPRKLQLQVSEKRKRPSSVESNRPSPKLLRPFTKGKSDIPDRRFGIQMGKETTAHVDEKNIQSYHGNEQPHRKSPFSVISVYSPSEVLTSTTNWDRAATDRQMPPNKQKAVNSQIKRTQTASQQLAKIPIPPQKQRIKTLRIPNKQPTTVPKPSQQQFIVRPTHPREPASIPMGSCRFTGASKRSLRCFLDGMICSYQVEICNFEMQVCHCTFDPWKSSASIERRELSWSVGNENGDSKIVPCASHSQNQSKEAGALSNARHQNDVDPCIRFDAILVVAKKHFDEAATDNANIDQPNYDAGLPTELELITLDRPDAIGDEEANHANAKRDMPWGYCTRRGSDVGLSCYLLSRYKCSFDWNRQCHTHWKECQCDFYPSVPNALNGLLSQAQKDPTSVGKEPQGPIGKCRFPGGPPPREGQKLLKCFYIHHVCSDNSLQCRMSGAACRCSYIPAPVLASIKYRQPPREENKSLDDPRVSKLSKAHITTSGTMILTKEIQIPHGAAQKQQVSTAPLRFPHTHTIDLTSEKGASGFNVLGSKSERASQTKESSSLAKVEKIPFAKEHTPPLARPGHMQSVISPWIAALKGGLILPHEELAFPKGQNSDAEGQTTNSQPQVQGATGQKRKRVKESQGGRKKPLPKKMREGS